MKLYVACILLLSTLRPITAAISYVVLQDSNSNSLIRISSDGKSITTIANGVPGKALALDRHGNYVVAGSSTINRITRSGSVTVLAETPSGVEWGAITTDTGGNVILADAKAHKLWRMSEDGKSIAPFAQYPGTKTTSGTDIGLATDNGSGYLVLRLGDDNAPHLYRVSAEGAVIEVPLSGAIASPGSSRPVPKPATANATSGGAIISDGSGNYLFLDDAFSENIFHLDTRGVVARLASVPGRTCLCSAGLARNPETGEILVTSLSKVLRIASNGSFLGELTSDPRVISPRASVAESAE